MSSKESLISGNKRVFFIVSSFSKGSNLLKYTLNTRKGMKNLKAGEKGEFVNYKIYSNDKYIISICSFEIIPSELTDNIKDKESNMFKAKIILTNSKNYNFEGFIFFRKKDKNTFIYDFKFNAHISWTRKVTNPPPSIVFSNDEKLNIYLDFMKSKKIFSTDNIYIDLIQDSQCLIFKDNFSMSFYMPIFKVCYAQKMIKLIVAGFKLEKSSLPTNFNYKDYSTILGIIEKKPAYITKHIVKKDEKGIKEESFKLMLSFYTLLFYLRFNYDKEKALSMLQNKDLLPYFVDFLPKYPGYFPNLICSDELIDKMFEGKLTLVQIKGIFSYVGNVERILIFINKNKKMIKTSCLENKKVFIMSSLGHAAESDNIDNISAEIARIIPYEIDEKVCFISFDIKFWESYIILNNDLKNLEIIKASIELCSKVEKSLSSDKLGLNQKYHNIGINLINNGILNNEKLLDFIQIDSYFFGRNIDKNNTYLTILKGLDFENMTDIFYQKWKISGVLALFNNFKNQLIEQLNDIKIFGKVLKLFDYKDKKIFDYLTRNKLEEKFTKIINTFKSETCPNFVQDVSYYIYIMDYADNNKIKEFLKKTIEKSIQSIATKRDIYIYLVSNYKDISKKVIEGITEYFVGNKERLNAESILFLLEKMGNRENSNIIKSLLNKIKSLTITEEQIFNQENNLESFKLLEGIQKQNIIDKCPIVNQTDYLTKTLELGTTILEKIKKGQIKSTLFLNNWRNLEIRNIFINKLTILFFNNEDDIKLCNSKCTSYYHQFSKINPNIDSLLSVLNEFYKKKFKNEITKLENLKANIFSGMINELEKEYLTKQIDEIKQIFNQQKEELKETFEDYPDYSQHLILKKSLFFTQFYINIKGKNLNKKETDTLILALKNFKLLENFFQGDWTNKIPDSIIKECYRALKLRASENNKENKKFSLIGEELRTIVNYFKIANISDNDYLTLENRLEIYNQKEDIFLAAKSCILFIDELDSQKTEFYDELIQIRNEFRKNIPIDNIKNGGKILEKYGLKILDSKKEDREYFDILLFLAEKKGSLKFLTELTGEDCRTLQELVTESDEAILTNHEIQDMMKCNEFIQNLIKEKKTDKELIKDFINDVEKNKGISAFFKNYSINSGQISSLFGQKMDKKQAILKKIRNIMKSSRFILSTTNKHEKYLEFIGTYEDIEDKSEKKIEFEDIIEYRGRAMLSKKLGEEKSKEEKEIFQFNKSFAERVNEIEKINQLLTKLGEKGYSENLKISINIQDSNAIFKMNEQQLDNYEDCSQNLINILSKTIETQTNYYKDKRTELIRYLYGRQFTLFKASSNISLEPFLKFLTNDSVEAKNLDKEIYEYDRSLSKDNYICLLENINKYLTNFLSKNNLTLEMIYQQNMVKKELDFVGLYTYLLEDDKIGEVQKGIEEHILNWYYYLTGHPPMAQTVLLCNEETTSEEITSFLYRAFLCDFNVVFMMGKMELLTSEPRQTLTNLVNSLFTLREEKMKSCLVFAYSKKGESIVQYLERIKGHKYLEKRDDKTKLEEKLYDENVEIIWSDKPGVGKSTDIKLTIEKKKNKKYILFPLGGEFTRKDIIKRLSEIQKMITDEDKTVIHLDLYDSKQKDLMKDFLYCFLVTKLYGQNEFLFYLSKKVEIIIEIQCSFTNFFYKFPILSMFKQRKMTIDNLPGLIIKPEINSNIQIVCNYLKFLKEKKLAKKDIIIKGVSMSEKDIGNIVDQEFVPEPTYENAESLSQEECYKLIKEYIKIKNPSYYQINSFINVLSEQLRKFSMNIQMSAAYLIQCENMFPYFKGKNLTELRTKMVTSFIENTIHFTQGAFEDLLTSQLNNYKVEIKRGNYNENEQDEKAAQALSNPGEIISCRQIKPALVFFHEGAGQEFSIITNDKPNSQDYNSLLELRKIPSLILNEFNIQNESEERVPIPSELKNYNIMEHKHFLKEVGQILNINNPVYIEDKKPEKPEEKSIEEIVGDYAFTADNFIKMILILLRIRANIPVIMMGETGCGKTSLIRKLYELLNNGVSNMEILNIHAGVTDNEIINFFYKDKKKGDKVIENSSIIAKAQKLKEKEKEKKQKYDKEGQIYFEKKLWVFLDEINTCNSMGLICEIMTKKTCLGKPLPDNIFFIAACNPYRYSTRGDEELNALELNDENIEKKNLKLVYKVNPLPFSLLNFVFNFGKLTEEDEKSYIRNMVIKPIESFFWKEIEDKKKDEKLDMMNIKPYLDEDTFEKCQELKAIASKAIIQGQQFVRDKNDISSVSLREIRRFSIFYDFFVRYLRKKKIMDSKINQNENYNSVDTYYKDLTDFDIYKYSINLSAYMCYYMRLTKKEYRKELGNKMSNIFSMNFETMPLREEKYIADNIDMEKGIAKNSALLENLFALFVCVNSKIPLFIVGKPGCSKSLSVQLLFKAMKGNSSENALFKSLPKLYINSYQGSRGSTSKGVLKIFKKARNAISLEDKDKIISMIFFDEMGLAENSPNNPLKVIHSELEYDLNEGDNKIAFVGISNWSLDASKMNRGLYLSIPQADLEDLTRTSQTIAQSYNPHIAQDNEDLFEALAEVYYKYKINLKKNYPRKQEYHGSRDFYHLVKIVMRQLMTKIITEQNSEIDNHIKESLGINSIERNFAGLEFDNNNSSLKIIKTIFKEKYPTCDTESNYKVIDKIRENIKDKESRYLLLISKSSVSNYLINSILTSEEMKKDLKKELSFYIGSGFSKDKLSEGYGLKILNKIQLQMEQDKILLLADLESVYPSLYDLFNQNFTIVSGKKYSRIAMGSSNNTFSLVNDGFKCIVFVDKNMIEEEEAPFLNRFEKHIISFEILLRDELRKGAYNIYNIIQDLGNYNNLKISYDLKRLLVNCDQEEIQGIIYCKDVEYQNLDKRNYLKVQQIQDLVLEKISLTLSQDIILTMKYSGFKEKYMNTYDKIIEFYKSGEHSNICNFLKTMKNMKNIIYTFSTIDEPLAANVSGKFMTEMFGEIDRNNIIDIPISSFHSENELEAKLEEIYLDKKNDFKIIALKFKPYETDIMNYVKFFIENYLKEKNYLEENNKKAFIFTIHMNRIFNEDLKDDKKINYIEQNTIGESISHLSDFYQTSIDNLNGEDFSIVNILDSKPDDIFKTCLKLDNEFIKNFYNASSYFNYEFRVPQDEIDLTNYSKMVIDFLENNLELRKLIINCMLKQNLNKKDIFEEILKKPSFTRDDVSIISVIQRYLSQLFVDGLAKFIFKTEKESFLSAFIFNQISNNAKKQKEIKEEKNEIKEDKNEINEEKNEIKEEKNEIKEDQNEIKEDKNEIEEEKNEIIDEKNEIKDKKNEIKEDKNEIIEENNEIKEDKNEIKDENKKLNEIIMIGEDKEPKNKKNYYLGNEIVKKLIELYLENLDISKTNINRNLNENRIIILFGLKLPGIYPLIKKLRQYIKDEIKENFLEAENDIKYSYLEQQEQNFYQILQEKINRLKNYRISTEIEIGKNPIFKKLKEFSQEYKEDFAEFKEMILDDYYFIFLTDIINDIEESYSKFNEYKKILKKMVSLRYGNILEEEKTDPFSELAMEMIWIESYSKYIYSILTIYQRLSNYDNNLFEKMEELLNNNQIKFDVDEKKNPEYTQIYKKPFYFILESILRIIISNLKLFSNLKGQEFYDFIKLLKIIAKDSLNVNEELNIYSKEIFTIQQFLDIEKRLTKVDKSNPENILKVLNILLTQIKYSDDVDKIDELSINIKSLYNFLFENIGDTDNFSKLILDIFVSEIKKQKADNYRHNLIEIILSNPKLVMCSYPFMLIILKSVVKSDIYLIENNLENIQNNQSSVFELINDSKNEILHDIILSIFENLFNIYFDSIPKSENYEKFNKFFDYKDNHDEENEALILFDQSLDIFKQCADCLENIYKSKYDKNEEKVENELICKLYCIAYIKMYLFKLINHCHSNNQKIGNVESIMKIINGNSNNEVRQMIKIYSFKIFFHILNNNYQDLKNYNYQNHGITFFKDLEKRFEDEKIAMLNFYMIPYGEQNTYTKFMEDFEKFDSYRHSNFEKNTKEFKEFIEKDGIDSFYIISTDLIISNLALQNYLINSNEYIKYSSFAKSIFQPTLQIPEITKKLFLLYSNDDLFNNIMMKKIVQEENIKVINPQIFEILLYSLRFCLQTSNCKNQNGSLYSELLTQDCDKKLKENCIPGNNILNNRFISGYALLEKHFENEPSNEGAYVCSCGAYYGIIECGFPREKSKCIFCGLPTGAGPKIKGNPGMHTFYIREGHYRIFKNQEEKDIEFGLWGDNDENITNMLLNQYKEKIINPILENSKFGINKPSTKGFKKLNLKVRNLSFIGYRLLNFILYSHLFYSNCLDLISNDILKNYICDGMTCIQMIETDWNLLKDALQTKGIRIIQIFMNLIFNKLCEKLKNCKEMKTSEDRDKFEEEIEKLLEESYKEYEAYSKKYMEINEETLKLDKNSMKSLVVEANDVDDYDEKEYPFYRYFLMTTYPSKESFIKELRAINSYDKVYPLISGYVKETNPEKFLIKYLPEFNEFSNYMIDYYSYQITREYASNNKIKDEEIFKNENFKNEKYNNFINIWKELKQYAIKFGCRNDMPIIELNDDTPLSYFLVDNGELGKGMYLAAAYQNFIDWQNRFLDSLIEPNKQIGILHHYVRNLEKKIDVQNAKKNDILDFDDIDNSFVEIIYENSRRNILKEDKSINYMNYKQYIYDFDAIEKFLGECLLPEKVKFNSTDNLRYITYCFEGFKGNKSSILSDFINKYPQVPLSLENRKIIFDIIKDKLEEQNDSLQKILFSIQLIIYYLIKERKNENEEIKAVIDFLPHYIKLSEDCIKFFESPNLNVKLEELIDTYSYLELLCFDPIIKNLRECYKKKIEENKAKVLLTLIDNKELKLITKETLAIACRRFISRYLVATRDDIEYDEKKPLSPYLTRYEFWPQNFIDNYDILEIDIELIGKAELNVGQCYELYKLMEIDEQKELEQIINQKKEKKNANDVAEQLDNIVKKRDRVKYNKRMMEY